jgi:hypothetical protein
LGGNALERSVFGEILRIIALDLRGFSEIIVLEQFAFVGNSVWILGSVLGTLNLAIGTTGDCENAI